MDGDLLLSEMSEIVIVQKMPVGDFGLYALIGDTEGNNRAVADVDI